MTKTRGTVTYCDKWNPLLRGPIRPISEAEARRRDSAGEGYTVLLGSSNAPDAILVVNRGNGVLAVSFLDDYQRRYLTYDFRQVDQGTLFMDEVKLWEYPPGDPDPDLGDFATASKITTYEYQQNGIVREIIHESGKDYSDIVDRSDVPLDINWERVPEFGDWASVARWNREEPVSA